MKNVFSRTDKSDINSRTKSPELNFVIKKETR